MDNYSLHLILFRGVHQPFRCNDNSCSITHTDITDITEICVSCFQFDKNHKNTHFSMWRTCRPCKMRGVYFSLSAST